MARINRPQGIVVHHSVTPLAQINDKSEASFNSTHKARGFPESRSGWFIGYHIVCYSDGEVRRYKDDDEVGAHCKENSQNFKSIGICLEGNLDVEMPPIAQQRALLALISEYQGKYNIPDKNVVPHRYYATGGNKNDMISRYGTVVNSWNTFDGRTPYKSCWGSRLPDNVIEFLKKAATAPIELPPIVPHFAASHEQFFLDKGFITSKKNLDEPLPRGEFYVIAKHIYESKQLPQ